MACSKGLKLREFYKGTIYRDMDTFKGRRGSQESKTDRSTLRPERQES